MAIELKLELTLPNKDKVKLTVQEARELYLDLHSLFSLENENAPHLPTYEPSGPYGPIPPSISDLSPKYHKS